MIYHLLIALLALPLLALLWLGVHALAGNGGQQQIPGCGGCLGQCRGLPDCELGAGNEPPTDPEVR